MCIKGVYWPAFDPLPDTNPVPLAECNGCRWPVTFQGNTLFCNDPVRPGAKITWCDRHQEIGIRVRITPHGKAAKRKNKSRDGTRRAGHEAEYG